MNESDEKQFREFCWGKVAALLLHPVRMEVIEALRWIDRPLSTAELVHVLDERHLRQHLLWHIQRLTEFNVLAPYRPLRWAQRDR